MRKEKLKKTVQIDGRDIEVLAFEPTFFEVQSIATLFSSSDFNLVQYWLTAFDLWLKTSEPISFKDLTITEGMQLRDMVPKPDQIADWLSFREAKSAIL